MTSIQYNHIEGPISIMNEDMTFHESYGMLPRHMLRMVKRFNVSPSDWDALTRAYGANWDGIRACIQQNIEGRSFSAYKAGV